MEYIGTVIEEDFSTCRSSMLTKSIPCGGNLHPILICNDYSKNIQRNSFTAFLRKDRDDYSYEKCTAL
jgi:hypothetical protein